MRERMRTDLTPSYMYLSAEVRWFRRGDTPPDVRDLFMQSKLKDVAGTRTDTYLLFPNAVTAGVKFRENRFEVKTLVGPGGTGKWADNTGNMEIWEKWSLEGASVEHLLRDIRRDESVWTDVHKSRIIRKYDTGSGEVVEVDASGGDGLPEDGCNVELTEVRARNDRFWTLGFESYSVRKDLVENLTRTLRSFFERTGTDFSFGIKESHSYPAFLKRLHGRQIRRTV